MEAVLDFFKTHYQFLVLGAGLLLFVGAIRDWKWVSEAQVNEKLRHSFIFAMWGEQGYRVFVGFLGLILVILGIVFFFVPY